MKQFSNRFGSTAEERAEQDITYRRQYETTMSEWLCVEAIVRQRDREATAASIARLTASSGKKAEVVEPEVCSIYFLILFCFVKNGRLDTNIFCN